MSDSGPKTDTKPNPTAGDPKPNAEDVESTEGLMTSETEGFISEEELDREILESSPQLQSLVGDLKSAQFNVSLDDQKPTDTGPVNFPTKLKRLMVNARKQIPILLVLLQNRRKKFFAMLSTFGQWFKSLSKIKKAAFVAWVFAVVGVTFYGVKIFKGHVLKVSDGPYHFAMDDYAESNSTYEADEKREPLYDNMRIASNTFLIPKIVVNIKASSNSTTNPMAAFEFYIDSISPDAILDVKEHEPAVIDKVERRIEEFNFDQLQTVEGKKKLCEEITNTINSVITQGSIRRTLIKTVFLKP